mmetsp:Transcript_21545/g.27187  ORF Transcript_21545/g.27187 Transcript_21545/m.27187 type:complete len:236 (-) Transcript_21545:265-972(-)|eukprot:CAMPEP_0203697622 /NCGR_PEP_ID=MMETSP0091-20130426/11468_1 /ASSEMBLY_ACC=CAM_ASM_001089 /TAXON_ID=426623 /ORGANISM="Chaetoceros affinis, Strain CCMP159" /LENGTH=235 /DNA_ID=CAMNT_0050569663 /DNA_START=47 /DNA_END=754 /DNA_ORIENTATION=+
MAKDNTEYDKAFNAMIEPLMAAVGSTLNEDEMGIMGKAGEELKAQMPSPGLAVGSKAPDFTLPDALGSNVTLSEELKAGPVILLFYRGSWCPVCSMHLNEFKKLVSAFKEEYNAQIIAVTPQLTEISKKQVQEADFPFKVCSDLDDTVMKAYKLHFNLDPELAEVYKKFNFQVESDNGGRLSLPVPGTFVIDKKGNIRAMQADTDYTNRMKPAEITETLNTIKRDSTGVLCNCLA